MAALGSPGEIARFSNGRKIAELVCFHNFANSIGKSYGVNTI